MLALLVLLFKSVKKDVYMKRVGMGLVHYVFMIAVVLFLIVSLSSCNMTGNVILNGKDLIIEKMIGLCVPNRISLKSDTSNLVVGKVDTTVNNELTGDFRYDIMFK
jgi:hypothetical protein